MNPERGIFIETTMPGGRAQRTMRIPGLEVNARPSATNGSRQTGSFLGRVREHIFCRKKGFPAHSHRNAVPLMIQIDDVCKSYGDRIVLDHISLHIKKSTLTAIVGGSGQGKSVLLRIIAALERPDEGAVRVDGENIVEMGSGDLNKMRRRFGILFQDAALFDYLDVGENVAFPIREHLRLKEGQVRELVAKKLAEVGLEGEERKRPAELSGGMRKRVGLARALALDPEIIFFDEPTTGLDPVTSSHIYQLIMKTCSARRVTYVMVTHDVERILSFTDEIVMIQGGKLVSQSAPSAIAKDPSHIVYRFMKGLD
jgi:phospholipid/cholesterol/gamma-HCH transport system ATP-binding protein